MREAADDIEDSAVNLYPNPAVNYCMVEVSDSYTNPNVVLYSLTGQRVLEKTLTQTGATRLHTAELKPGLYILQLRDSESIVTQRKLIIK